MIIDPDRPTDSAPGAVSPLLEPNQVLLNSGGFGRER